MSLTLLAVDDDAASAELIVRIAERCGFEAFATSDPRGVLELVCQLNPSGLIATKESRFGFPCFAGCAIQGYAHRN